MINTHAATNGIESPRRPTFADMEDAVYDCNRTNGWFDDERSFGADIALLHSEVSEMFEAYRDHGFDDVTKPLTYEQEAATFEGAAIKPKPEGFGSEAADVLVRWLDTSFRRQLPLVWYTLADVQNLSFPDFDGSLDVGEHIAKLHALITHLETNPNLVVEYLVTWCRVLKIDLQWEFDRKLGYNRTRGHKHGGKLL